MLWMLTRRLPGRFQGKQHRPVEAAMPTDIPHRSEHLFVQGANVEFTKQTESNRYETHTHFPLSRRHFHSNNKQRKGELTGRDKYLA